MDDILSTRRAAARSRTILPFLSRMLALLRLWRRRMREREALACMDERLRRDIGITRADVERERRKPFWRG